MDRRYARDCLVAALVACSAWGAGPVRAQSNISTLSVISTLPVASLVVASELGGALAQASVSLSVAGSTLVVRAIEVGARGSVYVLERVSDGMRFSVEVAGQALGTASVLVGTAVTVSVITAGTLLSAAGEVIAFIPNEVGRALLYNQRLTY